MVLNRSHRALLDPVNGVGQQHVVVGADVGGYGKVLALPRDPGSAVPPQTVHDALEFTRQLK